MTNALQNLIFYCTSGRIFNKKALAILKSNNSLDLASEDGLVFKLATKHSNPELLAALLKYYEEHKLNGDRESQEYKIALWALKKIIDNLELCYDLKEKGVYEVLKPYLSEDEEEKQDEPDNLNEVSEGVDEEEEQDEIATEEDYIPYVPQTSEFALPDTLPHQRHLSGDNDNDSPEIY